MKNRIIWTTFIFLLLGSLFFWYSHPRNHKTVEIKGKKFNVELAQSQEEKSLGLGRRENIKENGGMLFIFSQSAEYLFWMENMKFDLDIIWIDNKKIVYIKKNADHTSLDAISPEVKADMVLEIKAGTAKKYDFKLGDEVKIY